MTVDKNKIHNIVNTFKLKVVLGLIGIKSESDKPGIEVGSFVFVIRLCSN